MGRTNPYDDYDIYDPYDDDEDASGAFSFVEDEYDSIDQGSGDGFTYVDSPFDMSAAQEASSREFPATQLHAPYVDPIPSPQPSTQDGVLRRRRRKRDDKEGQPSLNARQPVDARRPIVQEPPLERVPRKRRRKHHFGCLFTLILIVALVVGAYWVVAHPIDERLAFSPAEQESVQGTLSWSIPGFPYYALALGSDAREGDTFSRTDSMVLMRVDLVGGKLTLVSIPRDTLVEIDGHGKQKINAAYAFGGAGGAVKEVAKITGVPINHVAVIHFEELVGLIDYLGGVTVNVPVDVYDPDYTGLALSSGIQTMDGQTALLWARTRHGFENDDYQRQEDQRILLTAIMNRVLSLSPAEIPKALEYIGDLVGTDMRCYNLVPLFLRFKLTNPTVYSCALPTSSEVIDGTWYEILDEYAASNLMKVVDSGGSPNA